MQASDPTTATDAATDAASHPASADADTLVLPERSAGPPSTVPTLRPEDEVLRPGEGAPAADDPLAQAVVLRVLAWHNRHRLARPIRAEQVQSVGVVALPFAPQGKKGPQPTFDERFADALPLHALRRFAARHATAQRPGSAAWPQRDVGPGAKAAADAPEQRYLITAAIEHGGNRLRLLLAPGDAGPVIGPRAWRWPPRLVAAGAGATALVLSATVGAVLWWLQPAAHPSPAAAASGAASSVPLAQAQKPAHAASAPASAVARAEAAPAAASAASAVHGEHGEPAQAHAAPASSAGEGAGHAAAHAEAAPAPLADHAPVKPPPSSATASTPLLQARPAPLITPRALADAAAATPAAPRPPDHPLDLFALASRPAATKALAEHDLAGLRDLVSLEPHATATHLEVMPLQGRWLVVWWPFVSRAQAEHARAQWQAVVPAVASQGWQVMNF
jgi:hypothetical protein